MKPKFHIPVMVEEILDYLQAAPGQIIVDATVGTGGHSEQILKRITPGGRLIGFDRDEDSLAVARERLRNFSASCEFVHGNFADIDSALLGFGIQKVDGIFFDLGISSYQLEDPARGFSFQNEGPLDMRLDKNSYISAYDLINNLTEEEISSLIWTFGQERWHNRIAHLLIKERQRSPIVTTAQLADIVSRAIPSRFRHRYYRIHPATRTFQAVRIAVNRELENLETALQKSIELLNKDARICVISFHSLEDRIAKICFRNASTEKRLRLITPKPQMPLQSEIEGNLSSRSAKLRVAERI